MRKWMAGRMRAAEQQIDDFVVLLREVQVEQPENL